MPISMPETLLIPGTRVKISAIGFGTSGIMGAANTDRGRLQLLDCAFNEGITHFDTAPLYGMGDAEPLLGKFLRRNRHAVTVATKFGLSPPQISRVKRLGAPLARVLYNRSALLKRMIDSMAFNSGAKKSADVVTATAQSPSESGRRHASFEPDEMEHQLNGSLRKLGTDCIDIYLMHDCGPTAITDEMVERLCKFVEQGKIQAFGLATGRQSSDSILTQFAEIRWVVQVASSILDAELQDVVRKNSQLTITHSALNQTVGPLSQALSDPAILRRWSDTLDCDLANASAIASVLLMQARHANRDGVVLFSSRKPEHLRANVRAIKNPNIPPERIAAFTLMVRQELMSK